MCQTLVYANPVYQKQFIKKDPNYSIHSENHTNILPDYKTDAHPLTPFLITFPLLKDILMKKKLYGL